LTRTTAILCIARNETPFAEEWLEYHLGLGIDRIYYVSTDSDFHEVQQFFGNSRYRFGVELFHFDTFTPGWQIRCYNQFLPLIQEDWILVVDLDEFLYLNPFSSIQDFLSGFPDDVGQIQFPWLILMSKDYCSDRVLEIAGHAEKHVSDHVKSMVFRQCTTGLGVHSHNISQFKSCLSSGVVTERKDRHELFLTDTAYYHQHPFVLHFFSRGHYDALNRIMDHQFFNSKNGERERSRVLDYLLNEPSWSNIPTRYMLMEFYSTLTTVDTRCENLPELESKTDLANLKTILLRNIKKVIDCDWVHLEALETSFENRFHLSEKLATQSVSGLCTLDDYRECKTQLEYVAKLRKSLQGSQDPTTARRWPKRIN
jgi:hypothetical protein